MNDLKNKIDENIENNNIPPHIEVRSFIPQLKSDLKNKEVKDAFIRILGEDIAPRFIQNIISVAASSKLKKCDPQTIIKSALVAGYTRLSFDPNLGQCALIPYGDKATFQIMKKGLLQLAHRTGTLSKFWTCKVYEGDIAFFNKFTGEIEWNHENEKRDILIGYANYMKLNGGFENTLYMTIEGIQAHGQKYSKSYFSPEGLWQKDFNVMAEKTVSKLNLSRYAELDPFKDINHQRLCAGLKYDGGIPATYNIENIDNNIDYL